MLAIKVDLDAFIKGYIAREIKKMYLSYLYQLEDLVEEEYISKEKYQILRKRVLDFGNECVRSTLEQLDQLEVSFKKKDNSK